MVNDTGVKYNAMMIYSNKKTPSLLKRFDVKHFCQLDNSHSDAYLPTLVFPLVTIVDIVDVS